MRWAVALVLLGTGIAVAAAAAPQEPDTARTIGQIETARGLTFRRPPEILRVPVDDARYVALARSRDRVPIECSSGLLRMQGIAEALPDLDRDRVLATAQAEPLAIRVALAQILDAQHYPEWIRGAGSLAGDAGVAQRGLIAASACAAAAGGLGPAPSEPPADPLAEATLRMDPTSDDLSLFRTASLAASGFLQRQADREAPFRRPPRSTAELLVPGLWERSRPPVEIGGDLTPPPGCEPDRDESLGVFALLLGFAEHGGAIPRGALAGWHGDRLLTFTCENGREPWLYSAAFENEGDAEDFRRAADALLPKDLARPIEIASDGVRVSAWHDLPEKSARAFGAPRDRAER